VFKVWREKDFAGNLTIFPVMSFQRSENQLRFDDSYSMA